MKILIACEFSQTVTEQFILLDQGHDVISCDLIPAEKSYPHHQGDVLELIKSEKFDLMVGFPDCTHLTVSGARHFAAKKADGRQQAAIDFFMALINSPIPRIAIENPVGIMSTVYRKPDQYVQPFQFGDPYTKKTGLWLKDLPPLVPTDTVTPITVTRPNGYRMSKFMYDTGKLGYGSEAQTKARQRFPIGIAKAMAQKWGTYYIPTIEDYF